MGTPADRLPDETLLAGLGAGDAVLAIAFVRRFQRLAFGVALTVISDPSAAEDVAQQAFEQAWRHAQMYDSRRGSVRAWLTTITHNLAVDVVRARTSAPVDPNDLPALLTAVTDTPERIAGGGDGRHLRHDGAADRRHGRDSAGHGEDEDQGWNAEAAGRLPPGGCRR
jgi:DNA-directed RNA polymerase specialized sigma24 family protein